MIPKCIINDAQINLKTLFNEELDTMTTKERIDVEIIEPSDEFTENASPKTYIEGEIIEEDQLNSDIINEETTELVHTVIYNRGVDVTLSKKMYEILDESKQLTEKAERLFQSIDETDDIDEDLFSELEDKMKDAKQYDKNIELALKSVRKVFDDTKKQEVGRIQELLEDARYSELQGYILKLKTLKEELLNKRYEVHFQEVMTYLNHALEDLPHIKEAFKIRVSREGILTQFPKLVTRAKTWKLTDKRKAEINGYINTLTEDYVTIVNLEVSAHEIYKKRLLDVYDETFSMKAVYELEKQIIKEREIAEEMIRQEEAKKQALLKKQEALKVQETKTQEMLNEQVLNQTHPTQPKPLEVERKVHDKPFQKEEKERFFMLLETLNISLDNLTEPKRLMLIKNVLDILFNKTHPLNETMLKFLPTPKDGILFVNFLTEVNE